MAEHPSNPGPGRPVAAAPTAGVAGSPTPPRRPRARWHYAGVIASRVRATELLRARWTLLAALGTFAIGGFVKLTSEVNEGELDAFDRTVLSAVISMRVAHWNGSAVDVTALGSVTVLTLIVIIAGIVFLLIRDRQSLAQLLIAAIGGSIGSTVLKRVLERQRPDEISRLVEVSSFSTRWPFARVPSIYLTRDPVSRRMRPSQRVRNRAHDGDRARGRIGFSRPTGVHYPATSRGVHARRRLGAARELDVLVHARERPQPAAPSQRGQLRVLTRQRAQKPGGRSKPPRRSASLPAKSIGVWSSRYGPMICTPTGRPSAVRPIGAAVAGKSALVASETHANMS